MNKVEENTFAKAFEEICQGKRKYAFNIDKLSILKIRDMLFLVLMIATILFMLFVIVFAGLVVVHYAIRLFEITFPGGLW